MKKAEVVKALGPVGVLLACAQVSERVAFDGSDAVNLLVASGASRTRSVHLRDESDGGPFCIERAELRIGGMTLNADWHRAPTGEEIEQCRRSGRRSVLLEDKEVSREVPS